jgi:hypothetical protein
VEASTPGVVSLAARLPAPRSPRGGIMMESRRNHAPRWASSLLPLALAHLPHQTVGRIGELDAGPKRRSPWSD